MDTMVLPYRLSGDLTVTKVGPSSCSAVAPPPTAWNSSVEASRVSLVRPLPRRSGPTAWNSKASLAPATSVQLRSVLHSVQVDLSVAASAAAVLRSTHHLVVDVRRTSASCLCHKPWLSLSEL